MKHALIAAALALLPGVSHAAVVNWSADLAPGNEVPPVVGSNGTGSATGTLDTIGQILTWTIQWSDLTGPATGGHFHGPALPDANAGVQVNFGALSGLTSPSIGGTLISQAQIDDLLAGLWYINIHTVMFPGGEIRGQVVPGQVPLPAGLPLMLTSAVLLAGLSRRR
jgi:hypothetical protein